MIRKFRNQDIESVLEIWLNASTIAHSFVPKFFWEERLDDMRNVYIPNSETWVYEIDGRISGFVSLHQNTLAAIFVSPSQQRNGIGKKLLNKAKHLRKRLYLTVYSENSNAVAFYKKHDFIIVQEQEDEHTQKKEFLMEWNHHLCPIEKRVPC